MKHFKTGKGLDDCDQAGLLEHLAWIQKQNNRRPLCAGGQDLAGLLLAEQLVKRTALEIAALAKDARDQAARDALSEMVLQLGIGLHDSGIQAEILVQHEAFTA